MSKNKQSNNKSVTECHNAYYPIIIVEGMDNSGKDFIIDIINKLIREYNDEHKDWYNSILNIHCTKPVYDSKISNEEYKQIYIKENNCLMNYVLHSVQHNSCVILNRSYFSDYVYGPLYRNISFITERHIQESIFDYMVRMILIDPLLNPDPNYHYISKEPEYKTITKCLYNNILYIQLHTPIEFLLANDDGKSQSKNNKDLIVQEAGLYDINYYHQNYYSKYLLNTAERRIVTKTGEAMLLWKSKETLTKELKKVIFK